MFLYRYFDNKQFAQDFMNSIIRLMPLKSYQTIEESSRKDPNDGITEISIGADKQNFYINYFAENNKGIDIPEEVAMEIDRGNTVSWQWHALCLSLQCNKYLSEKFNSKYVVGFNLNEILTFIQSEIFWKRILQYRCNPIFYCNNKELLNKNIVEYFRISTGQIDFGEYLLFRDCFVKNDIYSGEHEYRILFIIPGNEDPDKPIVSPYYFQIMRKMQTAILIEF